MNFKCIALISIMLFSLHSKVDAQERLLKFKEPINGYNAQHQRHGLWYTVHPARMGEPAYSEYGRYNNGQKEGLWYTLDALNRPKAEENYLYGVRNSWARYFVKGQLAVEGNYRGLNPRYEYDTIMVTDPITLIGKEVVIHSDQGSLRQGTWRYYDPRSGVLQRTEEYQVDSLLYTREYQLGTAADTAYMAKRRAEMPHVKDPKGKRNPAYKSLIE